EQQREGRPAAQQPGRVVEGLGGRRRRRLLLATEEAATCGEQAFAEQLAARLENALERVPARAGGLLHLLCAAPDERARPLPGRDGDGGEDRGGDDVEGDVGDVVPAGPPDVGTAATRGPPRWPAVDGRQRPRAEGVSFPRYVHAFTSVEGR